jgi:hypothetical protein
MDVARHSCVIHTLFQLCKLGCGPVTKGAVSSQKPALSMCLSYHTMTLVMSLLSKDYAIQVSDRRFVWFAPDGRIDR